MPFTARSQQWTSGWSWRYLVCRPLTHVGALYRIPGRRCTPFGPVRRNVHVGHPPFQSIAPRRGVTSGQENGGRQTNEGEARNATRTAVGVVVAGELSPSVSRRPQSRYSQSSSSSLQSLLACAPLVVASCNTYSTVQVQEQDEKGMSRPCLETLRRAPVAWHPLSAPRRVPVQARRHAAPYPPALLPARGPCTVPATVPGPAPAGRYRDPSSRSARAHPP